MEPVREVGYRFSYWKVADNTLYIEEPKTCECITSKGKAK